MSSIGSHGSGNHSESRAETILETQRSPYGDSPGRAHLRQEAVRRLEMQANKMRRRANRLHEDLRVGEVVQFGLSDFDRTKIDYRNLTAMVVEVRTNYMKRGNKRPLVRPKYRIATKEGYLDRWLDRECLRGVDTLTAEPSMASLERVVDLYEDNRLRPLRMRGIARAVSLVKGGQGMRRCNCEGDCSRRNCSCKRGNVLCNSRCHKGNRKCKNC